MTDAVPAPHDIPATSREVRERLVEALNLDLICPGGADHDLESERLPIRMRPANWYPSGS